MLSKSPLLENIVSEILRFAIVDAIYLYGSRAKGMAREDSDWDIGVLYSEFERDLLERHSRPQMLEAHLQEKFKLYDLISIVDLEVVPVPLQYNIITGIKLYDRNVPHVRKIEKSIISKIELDYL